MFATIYTFGHLVTAAFSVAMAVAFAISAARVPNSRPDWWYVVTFLLTASAGIAELLLVANPSLFAARAYLALMAVLVLFLGVAFHAQYAADVFSARGRRLHRLALVAFAIYAVVCIGLMFSGLVDRDQVRGIHVGGVRSAAMSLSLPGFAIFLGYTFASFALQVRLLLGDGAKSGERRMVAVPVLLIPLVGAYELTICIGVNPLLPVGGYFSAIAGLIGAFILAERFRSIMRRTSIIGDYQIEERIGGGGMADVYAARRIGDGARVVQRVALKRLRPELAEDAHFVRMFLDEARTVARLSHPNIAAMHDVGEVEGNIYLAMELVDGPPLSRILRWLRPAHATLDEATAVEIGVQIADALAYAHALTDDTGRPLELVHRDISPQNILVTTSGHVKLVDFGIARSADRSVRTETGVLKGKLSYMAPEELRGDPYDHRIDLYALGIVLFECLTGERPFQSHSEPELLHEILSLRKPDLRRLAGIDARLSALVEALISANPDARPATAAAVRAQLLSLRGEAKARARLAELAGLARATPRTIEKSETAATIADPIGRNRAR